MSKKDFKIPPVSMLLGSSWSNLRRILKEEEVSPEYRFKVFLTSIIVLISTPFHWWDYIIYNDKRLKKISFNKPPLFILGHWRSGTTMFHNMLCKDPSSSFVTTYQTVFPNNMASKLIFKTFMKIAMPNRRPADNMELNADFPQEDEFALSNMYYNNYYNFFYFPNNYNKFYKNAVRFENKKEDEIEEWKYYYEKILKKAYLNNKGERIILKNPVNTARIKLLLEMYPDAKFLYIYRNPVSVFLSSHSFFQVIVKTLMLHNVSEEFIDSMLLDVYQRLIDDYLDQKTLIPEGNLYEISYEKFVEKPVDYMQDIYENLLDEDFSKVKDNFTNYVNSLKKYKTQKYEVSAKTIDKVLKHWQKYMSLYGYDLPKDIKIVSK